MASQLYPADRFCPSSEDVLAVKEELLSRIHLPLELIDTIIDYAEYWPKSVTSRGSANIYAGRDENRFLLRSFPIGYVAGGLDCQFSPDVVEGYPTAQSRPWPKTRDAPNTSTEVVLKAWTTMTQPRSEHPVRRIVFTITSHDQGWGGEELDGEYEGSYTWFDTGLEEFCAYPEDSVPDQQHNAPWPQLRLDRHSTREVTLGNGKKVQLPDTSSLLCSLKTIIPDSVLVPESERTEDPESDSEEDLDEDEGLVGPPDELNPGSQQPYHPRPRGRCGVDMQQSDNDISGSSFQPAYGFHQIPPRWLPNQGQSASEGLVGPPDESNPGSQEPLSPPTQTHRQHHTPRDTHKFAHELLAGNNSLQRNRRAERQSKTHVITWSCHDSVHPESPEADTLDAMGRGRSTANGEFVRNLKIGDCITIWGKARFGGWSNTVDNITMEVYWAV